MNTAKTMATYQAGGAVYGAAEVDGKSALRTAAVKIAPVSTATRLGLTSSSNSHHIATTVRNIIRSLEMTEENGRRGYPSQSFSETLCGGDVRELFVGSEFELNDVTTIGTTVDAISHIVQEDEFEASMKPNLEKIKVVRNVRHWGEGRSFITTPEGYLSFGRAVALPGDEIWVIFRCCSPLILRPMFGNGSRRYQLVSKAYISGFINGEAMSDLFPETLSTSCATTLMPEEEPHRFVTYKAALLQRRTPSDFVLCKFIGVTSDF